VGVDGLAGVRVLEGLNAMRFVKAISCSSLGRLIELVFIKP
jgi:hypothetical protein